jgi:MFS-type transporter involved in bile tolerance (Atg22 family)
MSQALPKTYSKGKAIAWALYDWANSGFPTVVSTFVIAAYFTQGIAHDPVAGQAQWGWMQTLAAFAIALLSPLLGAIADQGRRRRAMHTNGGSAAPAGRVGTPILKPPKGHDPEPKRP